MYSSKELSAKFGVQPVINGGGVDIVNFSVDSRTIVNPATTLFFAIKGGNHNGHDYIKPLYKSGCRAFVVEEWRKEYESMTDSVIWQVESSLKTLQSLAEQHRAGYKGRVVAITGSNGKTVLKEWLYQLLSKFCNVYRSPRSYNSQIGVPLSLLMIPESSEIAIIEAGISKPGEMAVLESMIKPDMGIFTNIGDAHGENFTSQKAKLKEKLKLFDNCEKLYCKQRIKELQINQILWGDEENGNLRVVQDIILSNGRELVVNYMGQEEKVIIPFTDKASFENIMNLLNYVLDMGLPLQKVLAELPNLQPVEMRAEIKEGINGSILIQDYYNSDSESFLLALEKLRSQDRSKRRVVILSDFVQVTRNSEKLYREVASQMEQAGVTLFIGIGEDLIKYSSLFGWTEARFYSTTEEFLKREKLSDFANMAILLKGARKFQFERIATNMQRHAHKTLLEVDLDAMSRNLNHFRELVPADTKFAVMVKAFSYGCGGAEIASMLQYQGVDYLMVAYADEGVELREAGITARIAVMNPEPEAFDKLIENGLEPELFSVEMVKSFAKVVANRGKLLYPVHIKLNTGMNRSGFNEYELDELISVLKREETLKVSSIFSHLAVADESEQDAFTLLQIERFQNMCIKIEKQFDYKIIRHILNSAGIERFPEYHFDMVRLGIGLHGISAANKPLEPVATFKTHIAAIRQVKSSETIGYGRKGVLARDSRIAVILVGYADGLDRHLSCGVGEMYIKGHRVPIVGNICMDACMLDVTDYPDIQVGDEVEIFGKNVPVTEISDKLGTIPYEVLTRISRRVKRVFVKE